MEMNVPKDFISDHGLTASVEEVFAFGNPQVKAETVTKAAHIVSPNAEPVAKTVQIIPPKTKSVVNTVRTTAPKTRPVVTVRSNSPKPQPVANEVQPTSQRAGPLAQAMQNIAQRPKPVVRATQVTAQQTGPVTRTVQVAAPAEAIAPKSLEVTAQVLSESPRPPDLSKTLRQGRESKTAAELATMIEQDMAQHPESPNKGLRVTVYGGATDWRAMLTIMPAAGAVRNPQQLRDLTDQLAERLRQRYDLAWE